MILCEVCKKQPATVHLTEITQEERHEVHVCARCAEQKGLTGPSSMAPGSFLGSLVSPPEPSGPAARGAACPRCNITFGEFRAAGRLGCPHDYTVFRKRLLPFLERVHGAVQHVGKAPRGKAIPDVPRTERVRQLRQELKDAIGHEEYERAVRIRDELRTLGDE
jgi:protein arginine kinase activator